MDEEEIIAAIRDAVADEDYAIHLQHSDEHRAQEGFPLMRWNALCFTVI